jgi:putative aldouronate transport system permease protein
MEIDYETGNFNKKAVGASRLKQVWSGIARDKFLYVLALPGLLYFLIFKYVPMWGIIISFQNYSPYQGMSGSPWVGLEHFQRFFSNPDFFMLFRNTLAINVLSLVLFFPLPIVLSLMLNEVRNMAYRHGFEGKRDCGANRLSAFVFYSTFP